jgi:hypothetical protein
MISMAPGVASRETTAFEIVRITAATTLPASTTNAQYPSAGAGLLAIP